ncbi:alpha-L-rhamnosidase-like protein [Mucilaginibacter oryzae]|uniref:Alpha-L-rhamnosidase-like protein n=2 Tax=Mucilaginibacter oryzae TaxID=468058 RepID=A0A316HF44_9SPHI|nr:alpha-L-rhamnosidase-like protein [Mucilaginibacter oryzae]
MFNQVTGKKTLEGFNMKKIILLFLLVVPLALSAQTPWQAKWIADPNARDEPNAWYCYREDFFTGKVPARALAKIAIDTKYWLWINGRMVIFEGGLKRGPNSKDTYYDEVDIAKYLVNGRNTIAVLGWYFGKDGFSHISSGQPGLLFECITPEFKVLSDTSWKVIRHPAYGTCPPPLPNFRLAESSIKFDAGNDIANWYTANYSTVKWNNAKVMGPASAAPWNNLVLRPIPQWKDSKLLPYSSAPAFPFQSGKDTMIICKLPSNLQVTPYLKVEATEGKVIEMKTEDFNGGGAPNVYAQYVTRNGIQAYESYGWMNGQTVTYKIPAGVKVLELKYRETGYNTTFAGNFTSSDDFLNNIWQKSLRTLYITMRDNYMDCPDRERAQWWGDEVNESGEAFYALDTKSHLLFRKGMYELIGWQRADSTLFSPIPAGNYKDELPIQMLTSVGYYGFWNYYLNTGDKKPVADLYPGVRKYLKIWKRNDDGSVKFRKGGWSWGDWGTEIDMELMTNGFYYLALKGALNMAETLNLKDDAAEYRRDMQRIKTVFNTRFWDGTAYRHPDYKGKTDDRSQAVAVVSGIADQDKYPALLQVFKTEEHASPYMEKYVLEAMFQMGYADEAIARMKKRFGSMVNNPGYVTLFEGWGIGEEGYGGGTTNHAWSGGALTLLSQYLCGIAPLEPGYKLFQIVPNPGAVKIGSATVQSVRGVIKTSFENSAAGFNMTVLVPPGTEAVIGVPADQVVQISCNKHTVWSNKKPVDNTAVLKYLGRINDHILFRVASGSYIIKAVKKV